MYKQIKIYLSGQRRSCLFFHIFKSITSIHYSSFHIIFLLFSPLFYLNINHSLACLLLRHYYCQDYFSLLQFKDLESSNLLQFKIILPSSQREKERKTGKSHPKISFFLHAVLRQINLIIIL